MSAEQTVTDVTCSQCGCTCDDLSITKNGNAITSISPNCPLADAFFLEHGGRTPPRSVSTAESLDCLLDKATQVLAGARHPLIYGLAHSSTESQREAVALADQLGACLDTTNAPGHAAAMVALQIAGESTSSLGEVRARSNTILFWGCNPAHSHPRFIERFVDAPGLFVPGGRRDRQVIVVDVAPTETSALADTFLQIDPGSDFELLWALRGLVKGVPLSDNTIAGVSVSQLSPLVQQFKSAQYGAAFFGPGLTAHGLPHQNVEALLRLVTDLNAHTRWVVRGLRNPGEASSAESVLSWQTGYPMCVNMSRGYPRYNPGEFTATNLLERGEVDAVLLLGTTGLHQLPAAALAHLKSVPTVVLDSGWHELDFTPTVRLNTSTYGLHRGGTTSRLDGTPLPLHAVLKSDLPADHELLAALAARLR